MNVRNGPGKRDPRTVFFCLLFFHTITFKNTPMGYIISVKYAEDNIWNTIAAKNANERMRS